MLADLKLRKRYDGLIYFAESARNPPTIQSHHHAELEVNLVVQGSISYVLGGNRHTFGRRTLLWLFPAQEHKLVDRTSDAQNYVAVFKPALIERCARSARYRGLRRKKAEGTGVLHTVLPPDVFDLISQNMAALLIGAPDPDILNRETGYGPNSRFRFEHRDPDVLNAGLQHLLLLCWRAQLSGQGGHPSVPLHPAVSRALDWLSESRESLNLGQLARRCGASEAHLSRMFSQQVGVALTRYRNSVRLRRFLEAYRQGKDMNIAEAVYAAGFGSYAQFHRVFTQAYGVGPREGLRIARRGPPA